MLENPYNMRDSTEMATDPFSEFLELADARSVLSGGFTAGGEWALRFPAPGKIKFFGVATGHCWLRMDGETVTEHLEQGEAMLLSGRRGFVVGDGFDPTPLRLEDVFPPEGGTIEKVGTSDETFVVGGHVLLDKVHGPLISDILPEVMIVRAASPRASTIQWLLRELVRERLDSQPGYSAAVTQITQLMLVQMLRHYLEEADANSLGLLRVIRDQKLAPALQAMHAAPGKQWHLDDLARIAAMSRTGFAERFKAAAGTGPLTYLTEWRMCLAERALRDKDVKVADLANSLGYNSESAFSNAFKRVRGSAPRLYRVAQQSSAVSTDVPWSADDEHNALVETHS